MDKTQELFNYFCVVKFRPGQTLFVDGRYVDAGRLARQPWPKDTPPTKIVSLFPGEGLTVKDLLAMSHEESK